MTRIASRNSSGQLVSPWAEGFSWHRAWISGGGSLPSWWKVCELFSGVGVYISRVEEGSVAERAGLRPGDTILEVNGIPFRAVTHEEALKVSPTFLTYCCPPRTPPPPHLPAPPYRPRYLLILAVPLAPTLLKIPDLVRPKIRARRFRRFSRCERFATYCSFVSFPIDFSLLSILF